MWRDRLGRTRSVYCTRYRPPALHRSRVIPILCALLLTLCFGSWPGGDVGYSVFANATAVGSETAGANQVWYTEVSPEGHLRDVTDKMMQQLKLESENILGREPWCGPLVRGLTTQVSERKHIRFCWRDDPAAVLRPLQVDHASIREVAVHLERINMKPKLYSLPALGSVSIKIRPPSREFGGMHDLFDARIPIYPEDDLETLTTEVKSEFLLPPNDVLRFRDDARVLFEQRGLSLKGASQAVSILPILLFDPEPTKPGQEAQTVHLLYKDFGLTKAVTDARNPKTVFNVKLDLSHQPDAALTPVGRARKTSHNPHVIVHLIPNHEQESIEKEFLTYYKSVQAVRSTVQAQYNAAKLQFHKRKEKLLLQVNFDPTELSTTDQRWRERARLQRLRKLWRRLSTASEPVRQVLSSLTRDSPVSALRDAALKILGLEPQTQPSPLPDGVSLSELPSDNGDVTQMADEVFMMRFFLARQADPKLQPPKKNRRVHHAVSTPWYVAETIEQVRAYSFFNVTDSDLRAIEDDYTEFYQTRLDTPDLAAVGSLRLAEETIQVFSEPANRGNSPQLAALTRKRLALPGGDEARAAATLQKDPDADKKREALLLTITHHEEFDKLVSLVAERLLLPPHLVRSFEQDLSHYLGLFAFRPSLARPRPPMSWLRDIQNHEWRIFSQNGEDGVLDWIFRNIGTTNRYYVEFGAETGLECNTRLLREQGGWTGLLMDGGHRAPMLHLDQEYVTPENINYLFKKYQVPKEFDLLSIDLDFADYFVWKALDSAYRPRVVVLEVNSALPWYENRVVDPFDPFGWQRDDHYGCTLTAAALLAKSKGYTLIYQESRGVNAFFIRNDLLGDASDPSITRPWPISLLARSVNHYNGRSSIHEKFNNDARNKGRKWVINDVPLY